MHAYEEEDSIFREDRVQQLVQQTDCTRVTRVFIFHYSTKGSRLLTRSIIITVIIFPVRIRIYAVLI